jgi:hypothetical protein
MYDNEVATYPASYVSIFYPAAAEMEMEDLNFDPAAMPPKWGVPSDARNSALIEKINMTSSVDPNKLAWVAGTPFTDPKIKGTGHSLHPEDKGVTITRAERQMLIRAIDNGGQYYARQNTQFVAYGTGSGNGNQYP